MLPKMRYRLGLDLGTTSIGWCLLRLNENDEPVAVIRMGVRIFSDGRHPKTGSSLAVERRLARQMRRRRDRLLKRKQRMIDKLVEYGFFPQDLNARKALIDLNPYVLRRRGLNEALSPAEFARAIFHLNQRRGFKSNRKTDGGDSESGLLKSAISELRQKLKDENYRTLGEWLGLRHEQGLSVRARLRGKTQKDKAYDFYADRQMVEDEFDALWAFQKPFNAELFNDKAYDDIKDTLLFQRPLKPVNPGRCSLLPDETRAALALPSVQRFRILQELNNLRILRPDHTEQALSREQRDVLIDKLSRSKEVKFSGLCKALGLPGDTRFNLQDGKRDRLKGDATAAIMKNKSLFDASWFDLSLQEQDSIIKQLLNEESEGVLLDWLAQNTELNREQAQLLASKSLPSGYGNLSVVALKRIIPALEAEVIPYSDAVARAGFESHSALSHFQKTGEIMQQLPYYGEPLQRHVGFGTGSPEDSPEIRFGKIANPTVHIGLNEIRKVVNALIAKYGHPSEIIVEVARDLKLSREKKNEIQRKQKLDQDRNRRHVDEACAVLGLDPATIGRGTRRELSQKMRLWEELNPKDVCNRQCPYTGTQINIAKLLSPEVEIEHILPFSQTLDDSLNNKTVSLRQANRIKGNRDPYEAFGKNPVDGYNYEDILSRAETMPNAKAKRFAPNALQLWLKNHNDFVARALTDTAYLSRISREYLTLVCPQVRVIPGQLTAMLRGKFGLNQILSGSTRKNRDDHRHHAVDAAVIAVTDQSMLQRFARASAHAHANQLGRLVDEMPMPWENYRAQVERAVAAITVSHKPDHGFQGAMHEESAWGFREDGHVSRRVRPDDGGPALRKTEKKNLIAISSTRDADRHGRNETGEPLAYKGYVGGSNYCTEIWVDDSGKWRANIISTFEAYQLVRRHGAQEAIHSLRHPSRSQTGDALIMRLMIGDTIRVRIGEDRATTFRVANVRSDGVIILAPHHEANVDARNRDKTDPFKYVSKTVGSLQKLDTRQVLVSPIGDRRLWTGRKMK